MEDNKMYINIVDGDVYDFTYIVKEYEIIEKHYTPTITSKLINATVECCFEEDKQLMQWVREYAVLVGVNWYSRQTINILWYIAVQTYCVILINVNSYTLM